MAYSLLWVTVRVAASHCLRGDASLLLTRDSCCLWVSKTHRPSFGLRAVLKVSLGSSLTCVENEGETETRGKRPGTLQTVQANVALQEASLQWRQECPEQLRCARAQACRFSGICKLSTTGFSSQVESGRKDLAQPWWICLDINNQRHQCRKAH